MLMLHVTIGVERILDSFDSFIDATEVQSPMYDDKNYVVRVDLFINASRQMTFNFFPVFLLSISRHFDISIIALTQHESIQRHLLSIAVAVALLLVVSS
jgi:hypothetical protein